MKQKSPKIFEFAEIDDFDELKDLARPTKKRVVFVLSGLINLLKFSNALKKISYEKEDETVLILFMSFFNMFFIFLENY